MLIPEVARKEPLSVEIELTTRAESKVIFLMLFTASLIIYLY